MVRAGAGTRQVHRGRKGLRPRCRWAEQAAEVPEGHIYLPPDGAVAGEFGELLHAGVADALGGEVRPEGADQGGYAGAGDSGADGVRAGDGVGSVPDGGGEPAGGKVPGAQAGGTGQAHSACRLPRRIAEGEALHHGPERVRGGFESSGGRTGGDLVVAELHRQGRSCAVVRLPTAGRRLAGWGAEAGLRRREDRNRNET